MFRGLSEVNISSAVVDFDKPEDADIEPFKWNYADAARSDVLQNKLLSAKLMITIFYIYNGTFTCGA